MRKTAAWLLAVLMLLMQCTAYAETAKNFAKKCTYASSYGGKKERLWDKDYSYRFVGGECPNPFLQITMPPGELCHGLYICWGEIPQRFELQRRDENGEWASFAEGSPERYAHEYVEVPGLDTVRIFLPSEETVLLSIQELTVLGEGEVPDTIQRWQPSLEQSDLMVLVAHPDDEYIFMGGIIPTYAAEKEKDVAVCYMTYGNTLRRSELLDGLWHAGVRHYPVLLGLEDRYSRSLETAYEIWNRDDTFALLADAIASVQPSVIVTHDIQGEYGHGAHRVCADLMMAYVERMQEDTALFPVDKLYLHLYAENQLDLDWRIPLDAFEGKTALEVAREGFAFHRSQQGASATYQGKEYKFKVQDSGWFDNSLFGLYYSAVGEDAAKTDLLENVVPR